MTFTQAIIILFAILGIIVLEVFALAYGIDGIMLAGALTVIGGLAGYTGGRIKKS